MLCRWESQTGKYLLKAVENRCAASWAMTIAPPCPMHSTFSAPASRSPAAVMASGRRRPRVCSMASISAANSFWHMSDTLSSGSTSPDSGLPMLAVRPAMELATASLNALYPL